MNDTHASALATIRELLSLGATKVRISGDDVEATFDRVMVPLPSLRLVGNDEKAAGNAITITRHGDDVTMSRADVEQLVDDNEGLRSQLDSAVALGVI